MFQGFVEGAQFGFGVAQDFVGDGAFQKGKGDRFISGKNKSVPFLAFFGSTSGEVISTSNAQSFTAGQTVQAFSVRTRRWVLFDVLGLAGSAPFNRWVLVLEIDQT
ncbi:hypothetical protein [Pseudomonas canadensis]|uniref:hypothetical protein n=1 Tax=Pseudomonas canadensis TaxID=915099 RepID=UPI003B9EB15A